MSFLDDQIDSAMLQDALGLEDLDLEEPDIPEYPYQYSYLMREEYDE